MSRGVSSRSSRRMQELSNSGVDLPIAMPRVPAQTSADMNSSWLRISRTEAISSLSIRARMWLLMARLGHLTDDRHVDRGEL